MRSRCQTSLLLSLSFAALLGEGVPVFAQTVVTPNGSIDWSNPAGWSTGHIPGGAETPQLSTGTLTVTGAVSIGSINLFGGALTNIGTGNGSLTLTGTGAEWRATSLNSSSGGNLSLTIGSSANLLISTGNDHDYSATGIINNGTVNWSAGRLRSGDGGLFTNNGNFNDNIATSTDVNADYGNHSATFTNAAGASYVKSGNVTTRFYDVPFNNSGNVTVNAGTLQFNGGGTNSAAGTFSVAANALVLFSNNYTLASGSTLSGAGAYQLSNGSLTINGTASISTLNQTGGVLLGSQTLTNTAFNWSAGNWNASASTTLGAGTVLTISSGNDHDYDSRAIINNGTVNWTAGRLRSGDGGSFTNNGNFNDSIASGTDVNADYGNGVATFTNALGGTYTKSGNATTRFYSVPFNNSGTVNVNAGTLQLNAGGTNSGTGVINTAAGATTLFTNNYTIANGSSLGGLGAYQLAGGTLTVAGNVSVSTFNQTGGTLAGTQTFLNTQFNWSAGNWNTGSANTTTIGSGSTLTITTGNDHDFDLRTVVNNGTVTWNAGRLRSGDGGSFTNNGNFNDNIATGTDVNADYGSGVATFTNTLGGTYTKSGNATSRFYTVPFNNSGTVAINAGTLQLNAGGTNSATGVFNTAAGANLVFSGGTYALVNNSTLTGLGTAQISGGTLNVTGNVTISNFQFNGGTLAGTQAFTGNLTWNSGNWNDSGTTTTIATGATLTIATGNDHDYAGHAVTNSGTVNWTAGRLRSGNNGSFTNQGTFNDQLTTGTDVNADYGNVATFSNALGGNYTKSGNVTTRFYTVPFNNSGTVNITAGTLQLNAGGTNSATGVFNTAAGATTLFSNNYSIVDGSALTGLGTYQISGGTVTIAGNVSVTGFLQTGGTLAGTQTFTSGSTLTWDSGSWNGAATTTLAAGGTLTIATGADHDFNARGIVNNGTINWTAGRLRSGNGGMITNNAAWNDSVASDFNNDYGGTGGTTFLNTAGAHYNKTAGATNFYAPFSNAGALSVTGGSLLLRGGGAFSNGSTATVSGTGTAELVSGVFTVSGNVTWTNFNFDGGEITGSQTFAGSLFSWLSGDWNTAFTTTLAANTILNISGGADHDFNTHAFVNNGTINWTAGRLRSGNGGTITNNAIWNDSVSSDFNNDYGGTGGTTFLNTAGAHYNKTAGTTNFYAPFVNSGMVSVSGGVLNLRAGGTFNNGSSLSSLSTAQLLTGVLTANGTVSLSNFIFNGGQLAGNPTFTGAFSWLGGDWNTPSTTTIDPSGALTIGNGADHDFNSHAIVNNGTINWTGGRLRSGNGGSILNTGIWNDSASSQINNDYNGAGGTTFTNNGIYNKTAANTTTISVPFTNNNGTVYVSAGKLEFGSTFTQTAGTLNVSNGATLQFDNGLSLPAGFLSGTGTVVGNVTSAGIISPGNSTGTLNITGNLTLLSTAVMFFELGGLNSGSDYDALGVSGTTALGGAQLNLAFTNNFQTTATFASTLTILTASSLSGSFANVANGAHLFTMDGLGSFRVNYGAGSAFAANSVVLDQFIPIPEPSTYALIFAGLGIVALTMRPRAQR